MSRIEKFIPEIVLRRSLAFKTMMVILGAVLVFIGSSLRSRYSMLWIVPFLAGALTEWFVVATAYVELNQVQSTATEAQREVEEAISELEQIQRETRKTQNEINQTKDDIFSFISDSQGGGMKGSLEDRLSRIEDELEMGSRRVSSKDNLQSRVKELEQKFDRLERRSNRLQ